MMEYKKPIPPATPWSKPFWEGCKKHELLIQQCTECGTNIFYPKLFCSKCLSPNLKWIKASGKGTIYTYSTVYDYQPTEFAEDVPYTLAVIKLEEGVQMMSTIEGCRPEDIRCDMDVEVCFKDATPELTLPAFKPAGT